MNLAKRPWRNLDLMVVGALDVLGGVICIVSLGFYKPEPAVTYLVWRSQAATKGASHVQEG